MLATVASKVTDFHHRLLRGKTKRPEAVSTSGRLKMEMNHGSLVRRGNRVDMDAAVLLVEPDFAFHERVDRVIAANAHVLAAVPLRTALTNNDVARDNVFAAELFNAEALALTVASVLDGTLTFLVSHKEVSWLRD
jgi:hypothetical protein